MGWGGGKDIGSCSISVSLEPGSREVGRMLKFSLGHFLHKSEAEFSLFIIFKFGEHFVILHSRYLVSFSWSFRLKPDLEMPTFTKEPQ